MRIHILTLGEFGEAAADAMTAELNDHPGIELKTQSIEHERGFSPSYWPATDLRVLIAWRQSPRFEEVVDKICHDTSVPYVPVVVEHPRVRIGPIIIPGQGGCVRCFEKRRRQHDPSHARAKELYRRYDIDPAIGPAGYLHHHVLLVAAALRQLIDRMHDSIPSEANLVRSLHLLNGTISQTEFIPVHGCERCSKPDRDRTWRHLARELRVEHGIVVQEVSHV